MITYELWMRAAWHHRLKGRDALLRSPKFRVCCWKSQTEPVKLPHPEQCSLNNKPLQNVSSKENSLIASSGKLLPESFAKCLKTVRGQVATQTASSIGLKLSVTSFHLSHPLFVCLRLRESSSGPDTLSSLMTWHLCLSQRRRHKDMQTHSNTPRVTVWHPDTYSFKGYVSIWSDNRDENF